MCQRLLCYLPDLRYYITVVTDTVNIPKFDKLNQTFFRQGWGLVCLLLSSLPKTL